MRKQILFAVIAGASAAACGSESAVAPSDISPAYSVTVSGDRTGARSGISFTQFIVNGWREETNGGATKDSSDVTLVTLGLLDPTQPQTNLGLLGRPRVGTYRVRVAGAVVGSTPEFYGSYRAINSDGTSTDFSATTGTVTIDAISPAVRGTFKFHSSRSVTWPAGVTPGTVVTSVPASLDVSGNFVAKTP
jgi:hypothetical protein